MSVRLTSNKTKCEAMTMRVGHTKLARRNSRNVVIVYVCMYVVCVKLASSLNVIIDEIKLAITSPNLSSTQGVI